MSFDELSLKVGSSLSSYGYSAEDILCIGVSGGADSVCLLTAIVEFFKNNSSEVKKEKTIYVISVNHNIRSLKESSSDCEYVKELSKKLSSKNLKIVCKIIELEKGLVNSVEKERKKGVEEAARFLRYKAFEEFAASLVKVSQNKNLSKNKSSNKNPFRKIYFALAHNQNDQIETLVMRFLQGAGSSSKAGIANLRKVILEKDVELNYIRPLLEVDRTQIEKFLQERNISWQTDVTNFDNSYLRNRIRNLVIPMFDENFPGWKNAVLSGSEKSFYENQFIEKEAQKYNWQLKEQSCFINQKTFYELDIALREKVFYKALELIKSKKRIPYSFVKKVLFLNKSNEKIVQKYGIECVIEKENLFVKKIKNKATINGFFDIIEGECTIEYDFGILSVVRSKNDFGYVDLRFVTNEENVYFLNKVSIPFCFRSRQVDDQVLTKEKLNKSVSDVLSNFKVCSECKNLLPVIYSLEEKKILAIWGEIFGYNNWIVN